MGLLPPKSNSPILTDELDEIMTKAKALMTRKDEIEQELRELENEINSQSVTMSESLLDAEGFPRSDIDVHSVRTNRNRIIYLRNDYKQVMLEIEVTLHRIHEVKRLQQEAAVTPTPPVTESAETTGTNTSDPLSAFAIVNAVAPDSPAYTAGLQRNDEILKFGHVHSGNHDRLQAITALVLRSENRPIPITVSRSSEVKELVVVPRSGWGGRGTLGCHILPL